MSDVAEPQPAQASSAATNRKGLQILAAGGLPGLDRLPMLQAVTERLAVALTTSVRGILGAGAEVQVDPVRSLRLQEFHDGITPGAPIAVLRIEPWREQCLAVLDAGVASAAIELLLGGRRSPGADTGRRSYTAIERAVVERMTRDVIARDLATAFALAGAGGFTVERLETDASRSAIGKPTAPALAIRAEISLGDSLGCINFLIPYAAVEPMRSRLSEAKDSRDHDGDAAWRSHLTAELPQAHVRLRAVIERRRMQAAEVLRWQVGSKLILSRRHDEAIDLFCQDLLVLRGRMAEKDGRIALHVEERRTAEDWPGRALPVSNAPASDPPPQPSPNPASPILA